MLTRGCGCDDEDEAGLQAVWAQVHVHVPVFGEAAESMCAVRHPVCGGDVAIAATAARWEKTPERLDLAVWPIFTRMTERGIRVDLGKLRGLRAEVEAELDVQEAALEAYAGG